MGRLGGSDLGRMDDSPQNQRSAARRGLRTFVIASLLVCVTLVGVGSVIVTAANGLPFGFASAGSAASAPKANTSGQNNVGNVAGGVQQNGGPDIIPTCDCQTTQASQQTLQLSGVGKEILVSISKQQLYAYQDGQIQFTYLVVTGRPGLATPIGHWHVQFKEANFTFYSPWPQGSSLYYYPTHIHWALNFHDGGFYLHDSWWRCAYGPGANVPHHASCMDEGDPPNRGPQQFTGNETGSHGCVGMPMANAKQLYDWAPVGTSVFIVP